MRKILLPFAAACLFIAPFASAAAVLVDFDTVPGGGALPNNSVLTNQYSTVGVLFAGYENGGSVLQPTATTQFSGEFGGLPVSGQVLQNRDINNNRADNIRIIFNSPVSSVEFDFIPFGSLGPNTLISAFNSVDTVIFDQWVGGPAGTDVNFHYAELLALSDVARIEISQPNNDWVWGLDNLSFSASQVSTVPLPGAFPLLAGALGLLSLLGWRKKRVTA